MRSGTLIAAPVYRARTKASRRAAAGAAIQWTPHEAIVPWGFQVRSEAGTDQPSGRALQIRLARVDDAPALLDIYNHFVLHSTCTYQETPDTLTERRDWIAGRGPLHPAIVALLDGRIVGFGALNVFRGRSAYRRSCENPVYVAHDRQRLGIGGALLADLLARAEALGYHTVIAGVDAGQAGSVALHRKHGFVEIGRMREVGFKFGRYLDVLFMQRMLIPATAEASCP